MMITKVEALRYRCLRHVSHKLQSFNVLIGPNASGKSTFLDAIAFMGDVASVGPMAAVEKRTDNLIDLFWNRSGATLEIAVELAIPGSVREKIPDLAFDIVRYEIRVGFLDGEGITNTEFGLLGERVYLKNADAAVNEQRTLFPEPQEDRPVFSPGRLVSKVRGVLTKVQGGHDNFYSETLPNKGKGWLPAFQFGPHKSALGNLPDDGRRFPVATWLKQFLSQDVHEIVLNSRKIREASPPGKDRSFVTDGSNLPWVVENFRRDKPGPFADWISHIQIAFPDIDLIDVREEEDTKRRYITVKYHDGAEVPSWMVSDGTLRFLSLTLLAYLQESGSVFLIEEPENGIHPRAIEFLFESLSAINSGQLILATHSPIAVSLFQPEQILCFAKLNGATDIVVGSEHPALREWTQDGSLGALFQSGILG